MTSETIQRDCLEVSGHKPPQETNREVVTLLKGPTKTMEKEGQPLNPEQGSAVNTSESTAAERNQNPQLSHPDGLTAENLNKNTGSGLPHTEPKPGHLNPDTGQSVENIVSTPAPAFDKQSIIKSINRNIKDTKRELDNLHKSLLPKERQLLVKKEETALEVSKYFAEIKVKVGKYLLEQEQKIQLELENLSEKETQHLRQDVVYCSKLMETVEEKETQLSMETRGGSDTLTTSDLCDLRRTVSGYYDVCSQMKTYADEPFEMRFMINTDLEDMLTNCDLVTIELISARHTVQSHPSVSSVSSSTVPSTSNEPETANDDENTSDESDSESSVSSESEEEEESSEEEDDDAHDHDDDDNQDFPSGSGQIQPSRSRTTSSSTNSSTINRSSSASSQTPSTGCHKSSEDEPPPPYPGLPYAFTTGNSISSNDSTRVQNRSDGHGTRQRGHPMVAVYPPETNTSERIVNNPGTERVSGDFSLTPPGQESRQSPRYRRRQSPDSQASSGSSASLQETPMEPSNPSRPKGRLNERTDNPDTVHPALLLPSSPNPDPSAPPLPPPSFSQPSVNDRRDSSSLYPNLPHASQPSPGRSPIMGRRYPRAIQSSSQGDQHRPSRRFREKTYNPPFTFKFVDRCNTAISTDERPPGLVGISNMSEYTVVVDRWNFKLKLLKGRSVKSVLFFGTYEPWDVTGLSDTKCAVTVPKANEICFALRQGSKLKLEKRIPTARGYACIQYHRRRDVFICGCCPQYGRPHVAIVAMDGIVLKSFHDDVNKEPIFSYPRSVAIVGEDVVVVADNNKNCVIFLKTDGTVLRTYKGHRNSWLEDAQGVAVHPYRGYVIVSDAKKNSLHVLSSKGEYRGCIPSDSEMTSPRRLMMVGLNNPQLLVAHGNGYVSRFDVISDS